MTRSKIISLVARTLLGLVFFVFGLNGFLHFLPAPPLPGDAGAFLGALFGSGYMLVLLKGTEVAAGALLLTNRFVPLALALLAPIIVNIAAFHFRYTPTQVGMSVFLVALELFLAWSYRDAFAPMLKARVEPSTNPQGASGSDAAIASAAPAE
jgi:putative oxidoreductase